MDTWCARPITRRFTPMLLATSAQQKLEAALQKHAAVRDNKEKWRLIAAEVPGRSAKQCALRYKAVRSALLAAA